MSCFSIKWKIDPKLRISSQSRERNESGEMMRSFFFLELVIRNPDIYKKNQHNILYIFVYIYIYVMFSLTSAKRCFPGFLKLLYLKRLYFKPHLDGSSLSGRVAVMLLYLSCV